MLSIVMPVHNRKDFTRDCLCSLMCQTRRPDHIIVVDDGSSDGTKEMLANEFPDVIILAGDGNLFWTAAINLGIKHALSLNSEYILTMNDDTVASPDFVEKMISAGMAKTGSLVGALDIHALTGEPYYGGEIFNWKSSRSEFLLDTLKKEEQRGLHEVSLFPARGLLIPRIVFDTIGLFDEKRLPHYLADYDFTVRARRHAFHVYCNYEAKLFTYPDEGGDHKIRKIKTLKNYFKHLFSIKGGGNLVNFTVYTLRNCPREDIFIALVMGFVRRIGGFWLK
jgi:GT2 family glycosyltransferase